VSAYYNEHDPKAAAWLRELIKAGLIAPGEVDERSIEDVLPNELAGFTQCHFFAGIGVWSYALRCAGWSDDRPVWTGSCPCQPFSQAGEGKGFADERHLWPAFHWLIQQRRPDVVFGEQVESKDGRAWLDVVQADLEASAYAFGAVGLCAAGVGAPHIRSRIYFVADATGQRYDGRRTGQTSGRTGKFERSRDARKLGYAAFNGSRAFNGESGESGRQEEPIGRSGFPGQLGDTDNTGSQGRRLFGANGIWETGNQRLAWSPSPADQLDDAATVGRERDPRTGWQAGNRTEQRSPTNGFWRNAEWLYCRDEKYRAVEPKFVWMANGTSCRMEPVRSQSARIIQTEEKEEKGEIDATDNQARTDKVLQALSEETAPETLQRGIGGSHGLSQAEVLQPGMYGGRDGGCNQEPDRTQRTTASDEDSEKCLRSVWSDEGSDAALRSPQGRKSAQQRSEEFADFVRLLPSSYALAQLSGDSRTEAELLALLEACGAERLVQYPSHKVQEVWRSLTKEIQDRLRVGFEKGGWVRTFESPLADGASARVGRLRGYGNAIVAPLAEEFIRAYIQTQERGER